MQSTKATDAAGVAEPGNADPLIDTKPFDAGSDRIDPADDLMTGDDRIFAGGQFTIQNMQIGATDAASQHLHSDLARSGPPVRHVGPNKWGLGFVQYHRLHDRVLVDGERPLCG
jgi:hypothetical protein